MVRNLNIFLTNLGMVALVALASLVALELQDTWALQVEEVILSAGKMEYPYAVGI